MCRHYIPSDGEYNGIGYSKGPKTAWWEALSVDVTGSARSGPVEEILERLI